MSSNENRFYSLETAEALSDKLKPIFEGLDLKEAQNAFEEIIDDYCAARFGTTIISELRKLKLHEQGRCTTLQPVANGRALIISAYGFKIKSQSECKCGRAFLVLDEKHKEDHDKEMENMG